MSFPTTAMEAAAGASLVRAYLEIVQPKVADPLIPLRFNPAEYQVRKTQNFVEIAIPGLSSPPVQWVRGGAETLTFDALVDTSQSLKNVDREYVNKIRALLDPNPEKHAPPILAFIWAHRRFVGVLDGLGVTYMLFDDQGVPLRAKLNVALKEYRPVAVQKWQERRSSPDVEKTYVVRRGDTLSSIAAAVYGDPAAWRVLADANHIGDPRSLEPGTRLQVPRLR